VTESLAHLQIGRAYAMAGGTAKAKTAYQDFFTPSRGVIKMISFAGGGPLTGLRGWATHIERATPTSGAYATTEAPLADSNLSFGEFDSLYTLCEYVQTLGSGQGTITCTPEDSDF
jgi:hypothetical protein